MLLLAGHTCLRLALAAFLGGVIGRERAHSHHPAGMRTHILVAVGSALVMCTSDFIVQIYHGRAGMIPDPARLGAQVISGIGFLGAGTILREGFSVKGLTTAASLWAVSCIGLAVGIGFWPGALIATGVIYLTLGVLKKVSKRYQSYATLFIGVSNTEAVVDKIAATVRNCGGKLQSIELIFPDDSLAERISKHTQTVLKATVFIHGDAELRLMREGILNIAQVNDFYCET
ncbi:MAG: MgtC/SapB family protein [Oscillospiraceae bacterium]|nr:MgtC/SapB family protein [Oscillospiraceae bacterium]